MTVTTPAARTRRTRNPRIWWQYGCWQLRFWMTGHRPLLPMPLRMWAYRRWGGMRYAISPRTVEGWRQYGGLTPAQAKLPQYRPLPWPFGAHALGPFVGPWDALARWVGRQTGGRSHRCEFTDRAHGALWGHQEGAFMDRILDAFVASLDDDDADSAQEPQP